MVSYKKFVIALGLAAQVMGQRPMNTSICDYYTTALLMNNTAENQITLLTLIVNTAVIGNYTQPNVGIMVPGILASGQMQEGAPVDLLRYFNGSLMSTNVNGKAGTVNFLDDGGATPLMMNKPANTNSSAQYFLLTHLYQYFGALLGCSMQGTGGVFSGYQGDPSQYQIHKFMNLSKPEMDYFITQVGLSAASFGAATSDVEAVEMALNDTFNMRCSPPTVVIPAQGSQLQAICINPDCPLASSAVCAQYDMAVTMSASVMSSGSMSPVSATGSMGAGTSGSAAAGSVPANGGTSAGSVVSVTWGLFTAAVLCIVGAALAL